MELWLWFDLGYTLVHTQRENLFQEVLHEFQIQRSLQDVKKSFYLSDKYFFRMCPGVLSHPTEKDMLKYFRCLCSFLEIENDIRIWQAFSSLSTKQTRKWFAFQDTVPVLKELQKDYHLGIISNWDASARDVLKQNELTKYFDEILISSEVGVEKPNRKIFELAQQQSGAQSNACLYIGDNYYDDYRGSTKLGWQCILLDSFQGEGISEVRDATILGSLTELLNYLLKNNLPTERG
ncbi:HAD family hydrolase [Scatolibacter rhodanostii]|uniref:HAD family hydrolase n=1 Tax=Scatolibacter rhodanostii TaxID=2014781 RepID=UPI00135634FB|nr:HAD family hydrolase [Scatolibacter rhodanostii]